MKRLLAALAVAGIATAAPAGAFPEYGMNGLCPNAAALAQYVAANYPGVLSIGGVRSDPLPDHPSGHALDIMVGTNTALGYTINNDLLAQRDRFGIKYTLFMVPKHHDHVHVTVF